jgi:hypothetical protein
VRAIASRISASRRGFISSLPVEDPLTVRTAEENLPFTELIIGLGSEGDVTAEAGAVLHRYDRHAAPAAQKALIGLQKFAPHAVGLAATLFLQATKLFLKMFEFSPFGGFLLFKRLLPLLKEGRLIPNHPLDHLDLIKKFEDIVLKFRAALLQPLDLFQNRCILLIRFNLEETPLAFSLLRRDLFQLSFLTPTELFEIAETVAGLIPCLTGAGQLSL